MQVIGSGFGRTGTLSLQAALQQLGFKPCYHMVEVIRRRGHPQAWLKIARGEQPDWKQLFAGIEATVDFPACIFYAELLQVFPAAKVVHSVRDPQAWYRSAYETIYQSRTVFAPWLLRMSRTVSGMIDMTDKLVWQRTFNGRFEDAEYAQRVFLEHTQRVRATVPPEKLLIYDVREGWEPLCKFLGVPVPSTPFPHVNDRRSMLFALGALRWGTKVIPWIVGLGVAATIVWGVG